VKRVAQKKRRVMRLLEQERLRKAARRANADAMTAASEKG
jgi:hypothetical protein